MLALSGSQSIIDCKSSAKYFWDLYNYLFFLMRQPLVQAYTFSYLLVCVIFLSILVRQNCQNNFYLSPFSIFWNPEAQYYLQIIPYSVILYRIEKNYYIHQACDKCLHINYGLFMFISVYILQQMQRQIKQNNDINKILLTILKYLSYYILIFLKFTMEDFAKVDHDLRAEFLKLNKPAKYGTAGFRDLATHMPYISFRVGAFVATLNRTSPSLSLGVVMSASHNKIEDNGLKITNFAGNMLEMHYESVLEKFVMEEDLNKAVQQLKTYLTKQRKLSVFDEDVFIFIGGDNRPSTRGLLDLVAKGVQSQKGQVIDFGLTTTPQLQYYVYLFNETLKPKNAHKKAKQFNIEEIRKMYWQNFCSYFEKAANYVGWKQVKQRSVDCANGVGGHVMPEFDKLIGKHLKISLYNYKQKEFLNDKCGADFVKTEGKFPRNYEKKDHKSFVCYDGDADRIVFFIQENNHLRLIDGDRQGTILTQFYKKISDQLAHKSQKLNEKGVFHLQVPTNPTIGFVQTYYANYSSSEYLKKTYNMDPVYAATGVKHLHEKAEHYDIGIYYQANGHGTVIFNKNYLNRLEALLQNRAVIEGCDLTKNNHEFSKELAELNDFIQFYVMCCKLANPSVGDAITNFLLFEIALQYLKMGYKDTLKLYSDLKSKTSKIAVNKKQLLKVTDIEDKVVEPAGLQNQIDKIVAKHKGKKAFLRASGTENVLRLHVQAETVEQVEAITKEVNQIVKANKVLN